MTTIAFALSFVAGNAMPGRITKNNYVNPRKTKNYHESHDIGSRIGHTNETPYK